MCSWGFLRGYPRLQAGEETDSCGAGQGKPMRRQGGSAFTANHPQVKGRLCGVRSAMTRLAGPTARLAGCQVCGAGVRLLGVPTSLAVGSGQLLSEKQKAQPAREESPGFSWGRSQDCPSCHSSSWAGFTGGLAEKQRYRAGVREQFRLVGNVKRAVRVGMVVKRSLDRTALSHRICTGISRQQLGWFIAELVGPLMTEKGNLDLIADHWDDLLRLLSSGCPGCMPRPRLSTAGGLPPPRRLGGSRGPS